MSSGGSVTTGDKGENPGSEDKPALESSHPAAGLQQSHGHILAQPTPTFQHAELMKPMQKSVRPIAPAPTGIAKPGSISHNPPLGMSSGLLAQTFRGTNKVPDTSNVGNIGANLVMGGHAVPVSLQQGGIVQMNPSTLTSTQNVTPTVISTPMNIIRAQNLTHPTFPSHLPRGAVAASALSVGKTGPTMAAGTALLRPTQSTVQIPISSNQGMPAALLQTRPLLSSIKPGTPPIVRPTSPVIGIPMTAKHGEHIRPSYPYHGSVTPSSNSAIQITLRNANSNSDNISKPLITHTGGHNLSKPVQLAQTQPVTQSKIIVSQTTSNTMIPTSTVNIPKTAKITAQRSAVVLPTSVTEVSRSDTGQHQMSHGPSYFFSQHRGLPTTTTSVASSNSSVHSTDTRHDNRTNISNIQVPSYIQQPSPDVYNIYNPAAAANYHVMYQPRSNINLVLSRPPVDQTGRVSVSNPVPNLSATLQTHQMTMAPTTGVRFNQIMLDPTTRHPTISVPSYSTSTSHVDNKGFLGSNLTETNMSSLASVATVASNIYSNNNQQQQQLQQQQHHSQHQQQSNPSASPRPTILRKRTSDNIGASSVKKQLALMSERQSPRPEPSQPQSNTSSPKTPAGENSQSSTDTALSSNDAATPTQNSVPEMRVKSEHSEVLENGLAVLTSVMQSQAPSNCNSVEASPRKKPRKQLLHANEELKDNSSTEEDDEDEEMESLTEIKKDKYSPKIKEERSEYVDEEGVRWTTDRCKPHISLLNFYNLTWKARNNHFLKASDVKPKEERRPTVNELSNQKGIVQKSSGWKLYHMAAQLEDLVDLEKEICERVTKYQHLFEPKIPTGGKIENDYNKPYEMAQANIQRCQLLVDQLLEAKSSMLKVLDHKPKIQEIVNKHMSKRPIKKKERP